jgi:hypothetical protein
MKTKTENQNNKDHFIMQLGVIDSTYFIFGNSIKIEIKQKRLDIQFTLGGYEK